MVCPLSRLISKCSAHEVESPKKSGVAAYSLTPRLSHASQVAQRAMHQAREVLLYDQSLLALLFWTEWRTTAALALALSLNTA